MGAFLMTCLMLPYGAWLLGTGLRRLALLRIVQAVVFLFIGLLPFGSTAHKMPGPAAAAIIFGVPLIAAIGLLRRPPPRKGRFLATPANPEDLQPEIATASVQESSLQWTAALPSAPNLLLRYTDVKGDTTDREIRPQSVKGRGVVTTGQATVLVGYCLMRKGPRHFRLDRVMHAANPRTGEIIDLPAWLSEHMK